MERLYGEILKQRVNNILCDLLGEPAPITMNLLVELLTTEIELNRREKRDLKYRIRRHLFPYIRAKYITIVPLQAKNNIIYYQYLIEEEFYNLFRYARK